MPLKKISTGYDVHSVAKVKAFLAQPCYPINVDWFSLEWSKKDFFPWKLVNIYRMARMGQNFDAYSGYRQIPGMPILLQHSVSTRKAHIPKTWF